MTIHISIFCSPDAVQAAFDALRREGFTTDQLTLLTPQTSSAELPPGSSVETSPPGACGVKAGDVAGSILGWAGSVAGTAVTLVFISAVGPIAAIGALALASILGATVGGVVGHVAQQAVASSLPHDYAFVYEDALRRGRWLLIVQAPDEHQMKIAFRVLDHSETESFDEAREAWWRNLRESEMQSYKAPPHEFTQVEPIYRKGFEAALAADLRGHSYTEALPTLQDRYPNTYDAESFAQGYQRGQAYFEALLARYQERLPPPSP
ncbi:MAG: hypothetical protein AB7P69_22225 [Candidatus Binatia bacterium]